MVSLLLAIIYLAFVSLGLPDSLLSFSVSHAFWLLCLIALPYGLGTVAVALPVDWQPLPLAGILIIGLGSAPVYPAFIHATPALFGPEKSQATIGIQTACAHCTLHKPSPASLWKSPYGHPCHNLLN